MLRENTNYESGRLPEEQSEVPVEEVHISGELQRFEMSGELGHLQLKELFEILETPVYLRHVTCEVVHEVARVEQVGEANERTELRRTADQEPKCNISHSLNIC